MDNPHSEAPGPPPPDDWRGPSLFARPAGRALLLVACLLIVGVGGWLFFATGEHRPRVTPRSKQLASTPIKREQIANTEGPLESTAHRPIGQRSFPEPSRPRAARSGESPSNGNAADGELPRQVPGDDTPLPTTSKALIREVNQIVDGLIATFPDDPDTLEMKARALDWVGKSSQAVDVWKQCLKLNPDYIHAYVGMAAVAARNGNHQEAAELARKAIALSDQAFRARTILAEALINLGESEQAVEVLNAFLTRDPRSQGYFLLGRAYSDLGQLAKARASYESAVTIYPRYAEAFYALSRIYLRLKERDKARTAIAKYRALMLERKPTRPGMERPKDDLEDMSKNAAIIYTDVGRVYYVKNKPKLAERVWRRAAALGPKNVPCRQGLAWLYRNENRLSDTIKRLEEITAIDPGKPSYYLEIGRLHAALNEFTAAEHAFETAATVDPKNPDAGNLALVDLYLATNQNLAKAVELAHELVKRNPSASNYARLAAVCFRDGDLAAAENAIARAVKAAPTNVRYKQLQRTIEKVTGK